ncbi:type 3 dihydrofolate reductase [Aliiglaciecola sp. LCG003]|uniref:type 3 dihydrofolate reductase n=1 Tax=Aliiglaciecola sp. LCG003 TaxID=3053655 RepID=UPI002573DC42|nr:type 3 dihydrofolate reductase [Aliiglaciecola sp. LCG003]WJG09052.1 type 3 dihydrofolate reductase [Aliiglaciecola sp. LCG003]
MLISMIAAMANQRVIGADNKMPWHLPADLAHFKRITLGKPVVMGRKTYESIGKALPGRLNIVVSRDPSYSLKDATVVLSCEDAIDVAGTTEELMIIGGGTLYQHFLPLCQRLYLTEIGLTTEGDTYFPDYLQSGNWQQLEVVSHQADDRNPYPYTFKTLQRII